MKENHDKCYLLLRRESEWCKYPYSKFNYYKKLKFDSHAETICQKTGRRLNVLARLIKYMELPKGRILMSSKTQFKYVNTAQLFV